MKKICFFLLIICPGFAGAQWGGSRELDIKNEIWLVDHFISGNTTADNAIGSLGWRRYMSGSGSVQHWSIPLDGAMGSANLSTGTTTNSGAGIYFNFSTLGNIENTSVLRFRAKVTVAANLGWYIGFADNIGVSPTVTDGAYFACNTGTSSNWQIRVSAGGTGTSITTTKALDTEWHWFRIEMNINEVKFYIDDDFVGEITTNIPNGNSQLFGIINVLWTTDTTSKIVWTDDFEYRLVVEKQ